ncbi:YtzH-like family protein [Evansella sp. AB-P1]|uniref:YtzH-like family protein n=1 Tax=Evansella sp. AB-P1 TaxID=3037653 RepID=UPI00241E7226|nr:YtzH-like family protein [Evansella sp. AB-P1]MDG5787730.1 YtzH-like family protein [Evansella sp. AB-P1]
MKNYPIVERVKSILLEQVKSHRTSVEEFQKLEQLLKIIEDEEINDNFEGTLQEIRSYIDRCPTPQGRELDEYVNLHRLNISRWIEELSMLNEGGGAVTLDYEQRKGREI